MNANDLKEAMEYIKDNWFTIPGLIFSLFISVSLVNFIFPNELGYLSRIYTTVIVALIVCIIWFASKRYPKTKKGKIGFLVSINCPHKEEKAKIKEDFIFTLREIIKNGITGNLFDFIEIQEHIAKNVIDMESAQYLRMKCKAHFVVFGSVRMRKFNGENKHFLKLEGLVSHKETPRAISQMVSKEFNELMPRRLLIPEENDFLTFELTSEWIDVVAKYIIGIACYISFDLDTAERFFKEIEPKVNSDGNKFPVASVIKDRLPKRFSEICLTRAEFAHKMWVQSHDMAQIEIIGENLSRITGSLANDYKTSLLKSIYYFLHKRDTETAKKELKKCKKIMDGTWNLNMGFLYAYEGDLKKASQQYRKGAASGAGADSLNQIEAFILWFLEQEPEKIQYYYCLGLFNWKLKGDYQIAIKDFQRFVDSKGSENYHAEKILASKWIDELGKKI